ncbi:hypothetical protein K2173_028444 [Erythroxylum novogranatense]|uniref:CCHC-type domain-containing protein n=1 Tax=Erythroxylum novogranatense TaxID=1862640 RepID=A0AAV8U1U5_9ROSI|nr:hypothetical protein K2173_028444 [Erythroxylum novogranatense]
MEYAMHNLTIREKEEAEFVIPTEDTPREAINHELCLLGKLVGERAINADAFERSMLNLWRPMRGAYIKLMEAYNLYIIQFYHHLDMKKMLAGGSWSFNKCVLLVHQWKEGESPTDVDFINTNVWVQFHGLPLGFASEALAKSIGNLMGIFLEYDTERRRNYWNSYMRVRVRINVEEPLMRKKIIRKQGANPMEIIFSYERLPVICYLCGILGHSESSCPQLFDRSEEELYREWPEEIHAEVRARTTRGTVQWKQDPGSEIGADFAARNWEPRLSQSMKTNLHKIGNQFAFYPKKISLKDASGSSSNMGLNVF